MIHYAIFLTFLNETKWTPFFVHWYFQKNHNIVLTQGIMTNMYVDKKKKEGIKTNEYRTEAINTLKYSEIESISDESEIDVK